MKAMNLLFIFSLIFAFIACGDDENNGGNSTLPQISVSDAQLNEGDNGTNNMQFTVSVTGEITTNVIVKCSTLSGTATANSDFNAITDQTLIFDASTTEIVVEVGIKGDEANENDETFELFLYNPQNATLANDKGIGTIINDDGPTPFSIPETGYVSADTYDGMTLVWSDEFDGDELDASNWTHEIGTGNNGWGNAEAQYYRAENTYLTEGICVIEAREENFGGQNYTSSRMVTMGKQEFTHGRIDIRAALPEGQGIWPALWMLGANFPTDGWPHCGEIDIMELLGHENDRVYGTWHYDNVDGNHQFNGGNTKLQGEDNFTDSFHVFSIIWEQNSIKWLVDDQQYYHSTFEDINCTDCPFNEPFFFIMNVAVGGDWPGYPDDSTNFPQRMFVDYVRVFQ